MYCWDVTLVHWQLQRPMFIIGTVVQVQFLQYVVVSAMEEDPTVPCVLCKQETRTDSGEVTFGSKRLVWTPCLASVQLSCHRVSAELMNRCCLGVFSQDILSEHGSSWTPKYMGLDEIQIKLSVSVLASAESLWWSLWHGACHKLIYFDIFLEHSE